MGKRKESYEPASLQDSLLYIEITLDIIELLIALSYLK